MRPAIDPTRKVSEGGHPEHRLALTIVCQNCKAPAGEWCPMPGTTWNLCGDRINAARGYDEKGKECSLPANPSKEVVENRIARRQMEIDIENRWWNHHRYLWTPTSTRDHDKLVTDLQREIIDLKTMLRKL
jgi:hypothetical protein